jgi:hypothetical protein
VFLYSKNSIIIELEAMSILHHHAEWELSSMVYLNIINYTDSTEVKTFTTLL